MSPFFQSILDAYKASNNQPDIIFVGTKVYKELLSDSNYSRATEFNKPTNGHLGRLMGMEVYLKPELENSVQMMDSTLDGWPKPEDYE